MEEFASSTQELIFEKEFAPYREQILCSKSSSLREEGFTFTGNHSARFIFSSFLNEDQKSFGKEFALLGAYYFLKVLKLFEAFHLLEFLTRPSQELLPFVKSVERSKDVHVYTFIINIWETMEFTMYEGGLPLKKNDENFSTKITLPFRCIRSLELYM